MNWKLFLVSNEVCGVSPFLDSYQPVKEIPVAQVSTLWMDSTMSWEYLVVGDKFLWFVTMMDHLLNNPNQLRVFNISVHDNPFDTTFLVIEADKAIFPFSYKVKVISFYLRVSTEW